MMLIRPLSSSETPTFARVIGGDMHADAVEQYLQRMLQQGTIRLEWCFVAEEANHIVGTIAYYGLPPVGKPFAFELLELPWERDDFLSIGTGILPDTLREIHKTYEIHDIMYVLDQPAGDPQWQVFPEQRIALLQHAGFQLIRKTLRFEWHAHSGVPVIPSRLLFRSRKELDAAAFIAAIEQVSAGTFDQRIQQERKRLGSKRAAQAFFEDSQELEYDPAWWQLAYTPEHELVGLIMPAKNPTVAVIDYIGVVPQFRGHGYVDDLLACGTACLYHAGYMTIRADTDVSNFPMANVFQQAESQRFATRDEYSISGKTLQEL